MTNMFSGNREKQIPKTFKDCYKTDNLIDNLWVWTERLETIGIVLAVLVGAAAFITFIAIAIDKYEYSLILLGIIAAPVAAFLEYTTFHIIALLVGSLASIVQHTKISANVALYNEIKDKNDACSVKSDLTMSTKISDTNTATKNTQSIKEKHNENNISENLKICTGEKFFKPCSDALHKEYIREVINSDDIWTKHSHWEKDFVTDEKALICNECNQIIAFANQLSFKTCKYCGKKVPVGSARCECGCIAFEE